MTAFLILIKHRCPWIWQAVESVNAWLFALLYPGFGRKAGRILQQLDRQEASYSLVGREELDRLSAFLHAQPEESFAYFNPHRFDRATLERLFRNRAFLMMKATSPADGHITGYFFLRCFFIGRAFHGLMVGTEARGLSIGTTMWAVSQHICQSCGLRMFATLSADNKASMASASRGTSVRVVRQLSGRYRLIECRSKQQP